MRNDAQHADTDFDARTTPHGVRGLTRRVDAQAGEIDSTAAALASFKREVFERFDRLDKAARWQKVGVVVLGVLACAVCVLAYVALKRLGGA